MRQFAPKIHMPTAVFQQLDLQPLKITPPKEAESPYNIQALKPKERPRRGEENALF